MSTKQIKRTDVVSVEVMYRSDSVTLATSKGGVIVVKTNQLGTAVGMVVAETLMGAIDYATMHTLTFDAKIEVTLH